MSTTSAAPQLAARARPAPLVDGPFAKRWVIVCGLVPGVLLVWDAYRHQLGVNDVNYAIHSTGIVGLTFLMLTLLVTPLRQLTGWNVLISARRNLGVYSCIYISAHFLIFFWYDRGHDLGSTFDEITSRVYLLIGTGALVILLALAITSTDGMVTRLGARRWKALHRLVYLAALGGVIHFYLLVKADTRRPLGFAIALGALLLYRVVRHEVTIRSDLAAARARVPVAKPAKKKFWSGELVVARIFRETHDVKTFRLALPGGGALPFEHVAGQYINLKLVIGGRRVNRSYTIASSPTRPDYCEVSIKRVPDGYASHHMHDAIVEGDLLRVSAPAGKFVFAGHEAKRIVMLAGGVGITPMMSVVRSLTDRSWSGEMYLLFSVRDRKDIIFERELAYLEARFPNLHVLISLSARDADPAWTGKRGHLTREVIEGFVPELRAGPIMMCGPAPMMTAMRALLVGMGIPDADIHEEAFVSPPTPKDGEPVAEEPLAEGEAAACRFDRSGKTIELTPELSLLEAAEECGVTIPFECRSGICGQCKTRLISGRVAMEVQDALTAGDRSKGLVLACQAHAVGKDIVVDA
ncbi:MAG TPA: ferric reductase-like transmembrane domain-containing protein [Kofleriaceae bacterium]|nr:ferric reductase-like transmembrane domain-containing protein [Kofleriaceae bacterium]